MLGPLSFNVFINDFIYIIKQSELYSFTDNNTIFSCGNSFELLPQVSSVWRLRVHISILSSVALHANLVLLIVLSHTFSYTLPN